jgi:response regulator RpfG family c-di-GMP phosphodiesterase
MSDAAAATVLLVDDQPLVGEAVRRILEAAGGFRFRFCSDPAAAEEAARQFRPTVILQDLHLRGREGIESDGLELLDAYRRDPRLAEIPVMVLSAREDAATKAAAFARGASDYLVKLPDPLELVARIRHHSAGCVAARERREAFAALAELGARMAEKNRRLDDANRRLEAANRGLAEDLQAGHARLEALSEVGSQLSRILDLDILLERILAETGRFAGASAGAIFIRGKGGLEMACRLLDGRVLHERRREAPIARETGLVGRAAASGDPIAIFAESPREAAAGEVGGVRIEGFSELRPVNALSVPLRAATGEVLGVLLLLEVDGAGAFSEEGRRVLGHFASLATVAIERASLTRAMILRMIGMAELRDPTETGAHVARVAGYALILFEGWAQRRALPEAEVERQRDRLRIAAMLHDVGKVGIPDAILKKPGRLDDAEFALMQRHTVIGANLFAGIRTEFDEAAREVALCHHERWDGDGYPGPGDPERLAAQPAESPTRHGRRGEEIPLFARIVGLADVFDALSSQRAYKDAWPEEEVLALVRRESGRHFDPELVEILLDRLGEFREVRDRYGT